MLKGLSNSFNKMTIPFLNFLEVGNKNYNPYLTGLLSILLIGYASIAAPKLPRDVVELMVGNPFVKVIFMAAIVWLFTSRKNPALALLVAIGFMVTLSLLDKYHMKDVALAVQSEIDSQHNNDEVVAESGEEPSQKSQHL